MRVLQYCLKPEGAEFLEQAASICNSILIDHQDVPDHIQKLYPLFVQSITGKQGEAIGDGLECYNYTSKLI